VARFLGEIDATVEFADPRTLRLPGGRDEGADPGKLLRQIARFGMAMDSMPPLLVIRGRNGELQLIDGVTRATRVAKLRSGSLVPVEVVEEFRERDLTRFPTVGERLP
jgi:hypothetical protein